jgi:NAD(P)-dependent dehydrogenase (short-subunit alcohol dehydrogenase family)
VKDLAGLVAVVTGAGNGIGRAVAHELARSGMHVALADVDEAAVLEAAEEISSHGGRTIGVPTDVRSLAGVEHLADRAEAELGPVRVLVNNAGVGLIEPIVSITDEDWHWVMDVNYFGVVNGLQAFLPRMLKTEGDKHIVNTASMEGLHATRTLAGYTASKFAVVGLTEAMREELDDYGIGVSLLCPALVATRIQGHSRKLRSLQSRPAAPLPRTLQQGAWDAVRIATPESVAHLVLRGITENRLYLFTHPEDRRQVTDRFDRIIAAFHEAETETDGGQA